MRLLIAFSLLLFLVGCDSQAEPPAAARALEIGRTAVDYGAAISPAGDYAKALFSPDEFAADKRMVVRGTVTIPDGTAVQDLSLLLFPVGEDGPELILGTGGGLLTAGNPKAATDGEGRLTITTGPLWEFADSITVGFMHQRSPDHPFDLAVFPVSDDDGMVTFQASEQQREIDMGTVTLIVSGMDSATD